MVGPCIFKPGPQKWHGEGIDQILIDSYRYSRFCELCVLRHFAWGSATAI